MQIKLSIYTVIQHLLSYRSTINLHKNYCKHFSLKHGTLKEEKGRTATHLTFRKSYCKLNGRRQSTISKHSSIKFIAERELQRKLLKTLLPDYEPGSTTTLHNEGVQTDLLKDEVDDLASEFQQWTPDPKQSESTSTITDVTKSAVFEKRSETSLERIDESYVMPDFIGIKFSERPRILLKDAKKKTTITVDTDNLDVDEIALRVTDWPIGKLYLSIGGYNVFPKRSSSLPDFLVVTTEQCLFSLDDPMFEGDPQQAEREKAAWRQKERIERLNVKKPRSSFDIKETASQDETGHGSDQIYNAYSYRTDRKNSAEAAAQTLVNISPSGWFEGSSDHSKTALRKTAAEILDKSSRPLIERNSFSTNTQQHKYQINTASNYKHEYISNDPSSEVGGEDSSRSTVLEDPTIQKSFESEKKKKKVQLVTPDEIYQENKLAPPKISKQTHSSLRKNKGSFSVSEESSDYHNNSVDENDVPFMGSPVTVYPISEEKNVREETLNLASAHVSPEKNNGSSIRLSGETTLAHFKQENTSGASPISKNNQFSSAWVDGITTGVTPASTSKTNESSENIQTRSSRPENQLSSNEAARNDIPVVLDWPLARSPISPKPEIMSKMETTVISASFRPEDQLSCNEASRKDVYVVPDSLLERSPISPKPEIMSNIETTYIMEHSTGSRHDDQLSSNEASREDVDVPDSLLARSPISPKPEIMSKVETTDIMEHFTGSRPEDQISSNEASRKDVDVVPDSLFARRAKTREGVQPLPELRPLNINIDDNSINERSIHSHSSEQNETLCSCVLPSCMGNERPQGTICQRDRRRERLLDPRSPLLEVQRELARPFANRQHSQRSSIVSDPSDILGSPPSPKSPKK